MFQHDFRRLVLARDLLAQAHCDRRSATCCPPAEPVEATHPGDSPDHAAVPQD